MTWAAWPFWAGGGVLGTGGLLLLLWALLADRGRGRRRCPRCWYDLSATAGLTCPECGRTARHERRLWRTRRRWRWAALALVVLLAGACTALVPTLRGTRWVPWAPTKVLIWMLPHLQSSEPATFAAAMDQLLVERPLTLEQFRHLVRTAPRLYPPGSGALGPQQQRLIEYCAMARLAGSTVETGMPRSLEPRDHTVYTYSAGFPQADSAVRLVGEEASGLTKMATVSLFAGGLGERTARELLIQLGPAAASAAGDLAEAVAHGGPLEYAGVLQAMGVLALPALTEALPDSSSAGRMRIRILLTGLTSGPKGNELEAAALSNNPRVARAARVAINNLINRAWSEVDLGPGATPESQARAVALEDAIEWFSDVSESARAEAVRGAMGDLGDSSSYVRRRACDLLALAGPGAAAATDSLLDVAEHDQDRAVQMAASAALSRIRNVRR